MADVPTYYKILGPNGEAVNGGSGTWALPKGKKPGKWMPPVKGAIVPCQNGYHLCEAKDIPTWLFGGHNRAVFVAEGRGANVVSDDKAAFAQARLLKRLEYDEKIARLWAADCAERVLHLYECDHANDKRPREAIDAARKFARGEIDAAAWAAAGDAARAAAWDAAWDAARAAARAAAGDAAWDAAWAAARAAARAAAGDAAGDAEREWQIGRLLDYLYGRPLGPVGNSATDKATGASQ